MRAMRCRVFLSSLNVKGDDIESHLTHCTVLHRVIQDIGYPIDRCRRVSMRTRRKLWMSCTRSCILVAEHARTSQFELTVAQANLKKTRRTAKMKRFQDRRFQPLTHSSIFNSNLIYRLAANLLHFGFELLRFGARRSWIVAVAPNF